jgi:hypothetical protein
VCVLATSITSPKDFERKPPLLVKPAKTTNPQFVGLLLQADAKSSPERQIVLHSTCH